MKSALIAAGSPGVEEDQGVVFARLPVSGAEFHALAVADGWILALSRPLRASEAQLAGFRAAYPGAVLDIWQGETRLTHIAQPGKADLLRWADMAEAFVQASLRWRNDQRSRGEGY